MTASARPGLGSVLVAGGTGGLAVAVLKCLAEAVTGAAVPVYGRS